MLPSPQGSYQRSGGQKKATGASAYSAYSEYLFASSKQIRDDFSSELPSWNYLPFAQDNKKAAHPRFGAAANTGDYSHSLDESIFLYSAKNDAVKRFPLTFR